MTGKPAEGNQSTGQSSNILVSPPVYRHYTIYIYTYTVYTFPLAVLPEHCGPPANPSAEPTQPSWRNDRTTSLVLISDGNNAMQILCKPLPPHLCCGTALLVADPNPHNRFTTFGNGHRLIGSLVKIQIISFGYKLFYFIKMPNMFHSDLSNCFAIECGGVIESY